MVFALKEDLFKMFKSSMFFLAEFRRGIRSVSLMIFGPKEQLLSTTLPIYSVKICPNRIPLDEN